MVLNIGSAPKRPQLEDYRGISIQALLDAVQSTAPFLFESPPTETDPEYVQILKRARDQVAEKATELNTDLWSYYEIALASHWATVGTFVPTDVDLAIRERLWKQVHHPFAWQHLWRLIERAQKWDESLVSKRWVQVSEGQSISGHQGEWFTVAMAAYGSAKKVANAHMIEVRDAIEAEVERQQNCLLQLEKDFSEEPDAETAKRFASGVAGVVHNLGDLDRMFEAWSIGEEDVLKRRVFRCGHEDARAVRPVFLRAGRIYQKCLASENHRHFALREPKCIRKSTRFLLNYGPCLDDWGRGLVQEGLRANVFSERDLRDVAVALVSGWKTLNPKSIYTSVGYARALVGIASELGQGSLSAGRTELENLVPPVVRKELLEGGLRTLLQVGQAQFEKEFSRKLLAAWNEAGH